jgi:hypothetical protein
VKEHQPGNPKVLSLNPNPKEEEEEEEEESNEGEAVVLRYGVGGEGKSDKMTCHMYHL